MVRLLLNNRRLQMFLLGSTLSTFGTALSSVALPLYVLAHFHSSLLLGIVFVARAIPGIVLARWVGGVVDRLGAYVSTSIALAVCGLGIGVVPVVGFSAGLTVIANMVLGVGLTLLSPTVAMYIPALVPDEELETANGTFQSTFTVGSLLGTALGGWVVQRGYYALGFYGDAVTYFVAIGTVLMVGRVSAVNTIAREPLHHGVTQSLRRIVTDITKNAAFIQMLVVDWGLSFAMGIINVALPLYTAHTLHRPWLYSPLLMAIAVGDLLAGFMSSTARRVIPAGKEGKWYVAMASLVGLTYVFIAVVPTVTAVFAASFIGSVTTGLLYVIYASTVQRTIPAEVMGRFQTVMSGVISALTGGGSLLAGIVGAGSWGFGISACILWTCAMMSIVLVRA